MPGATRNRQEEYENNERRLGEMIQHYLPGWQELAAKLIHGACEQTGEPFNMNVRLDVTHVEQSDGEGPRQEIRCRIRCTAPEGNLMSPEIEHVTKHVNETAAGDLMHGIMVEVNNNGLEIKDVTLDSGDAVG